MDNKQFFKFLVGNFIVTAVIVLGLTLIMAAVGTVCWNQLAATYKWPKAGYWDALAVCCMLADIWCFSPGQTWIHRNR